jgi:hypothetical protein
MKWNETLLFYSTAGIEIVLFVLAFARGLHKRLPLFVGYIGMLCAGSIILQILYFRFGFRSATAYYAYWVVAGVQMVARGLAIMDLCRYELRAYRGVWALAWRIFVALAVLTLINAVVHARGTAIWIPPFVTAASRDIAIACLTVLSALLLIRRYYEIRMESFEAKLMGGMFFFCLVDAANDTLMRNVFLQNAGRWLQIRSQVFPAYDFWNTIQSLAFIVSLCTWWFALLPELPAPAPAPQLLPEEVYGVLSPAINRRLRAFNSRLREMRRT